MSPPRPGDPRATRVLRDHLRIFPGDPVPVPVEDLAEDLLGLRVRVHEGLGVSGMLVPAERLILVNASDLPERRRFTVAHEVAHWVIHCDGHPSGAIMCRPADMAPGADPREREANVFAADLLMPEAEVCAAHAGGAALDALSRLFGVSEVAMGWRLYNLELVPAPPAAPAD